MTKERVEEVRHLIDSALEKIRAARELAAEDGVKLNFSIENKDIYCVEGLEIIAEAVGEKIEKLPISNANTDYFGIRTMGYEFWDLKRKGESENA